MAGFVASWFCLSFLNRSAKVPINKELSIQTSDDHMVPIGTSKITKNKLSHQQREDLAGRTLDLSITVFVRAVETVIGSCWTVYRGSKVARGKTRLRAEILISSLADTSVFAVSAATVMWAYFYMPHRLPRSYSRWIGAAAQVDQRLITVLRLARSGNFLYGRNTGCASVLQSMCHDYGWPLEWGLYLSSTFLSTPSCLSTTED